MAKLLLILLWVLLAIYLFVLLQDFREKNREEKMERTGTLGIAATGFIVNFFDTLGIGSFAITTSIFKQWKMVKDRIIPGTLNTAMCIPIIAEALIFIDKVEVDPKTLISMIMAAVIGAFFGSGIVSKLDEKKVQLGMAVALLSVFLLMLSGKLGILPIGGTATGLTGAKFFIAVLSNFILGALMTLGIGLYAPCMALVLSLGMSPLVAFPIMMGSCAFLMPVAGIKFIKEGAYDARVTFIITVFGVLGVLVAAYLVKSLPLSMLTWV
ncbi:MAG: sulfite exporter TauE/SafE family protein, partial [Fusobacteriaceae bacterium]